MNPDFLKNLTTPLTRAKATESPPKTNTRSTTPRVNKTPGVFVLTNISKVVRNQIRNPANLQCKYEFSGRSALVSMNEIMRREKELANELRQDIVQELSFIRHGIFIHFAVHEIQLRADGDNRLLLIVYKYDKEIYRNIVKIAPPKVKGEEDEEEEDEDYEFEVTPAIEYDPSKKEFPSNYIAGIDPIRDNLSESDIVVTNTDTFISEFNEAVDRIANNNLLERVQAGISAWELNKAIIGEPITEEPEYSIAPFEIIMSNIKTVNADKTISTFNATWPSLESLSGESAVLDDIDEEQRNEMDIKSRTWIPHPGSLEWLDKANAHKFRKE